MKLGAHSEYNTYDEMDLLGIMFVEVEAKCIEME